MIIIHHKTNMKTVVCPLLFSIISIIFRPCMYICIYLPLLAYYKTKHIKQTHNSKHNSTPTRNMKEDHKKPYYCPKYPQ